MDKGAHFFRCDFQVHTPRDANWQGAGAVTADERQAYAAELILASRKQGLHAIAITDHHDLAFFRYVKAAAAEELDDKGLSVPADQRIIVFPGIELTLTSPTCQALLLLDSDFPENLLESVLTTLAINPAPMADPKAANVQRIPTSVVADLPHLYGKLDSFAPLKGRYIVLPNVTETGHGTLLRAGFGNYYAAMPCVGGYVDGTVSKFRTPIAGTFVASVHVNGSSEKLRHGPSPSMRGAWVLMSARSRSSAWATFSESGRWRQTWS